MKSDKQTIKEKDHKTIHTTDMKVPDQVVVEVVGSIREVKRIALQTTLYLPRVTALVLNMSCKVRFKLIKALDRSIIKLWLVSGCWCWS